MKLPLLVSNQVPEFVRADHPAFVEFLKAYYTWLTEEYSPYKIEALVDIDDTVDSFIQYFKKELDITGALASSDNRTYLKHIRELYRAKGSTAGIEFLLKMVLGKKPIVSHPWDLVFKPSEGRWIQNTTVLTNVTQGNYEEFLGNLCIITDAAGLEYETFVTNITPRRDGVIELYIDRFSHQADLISVRTLSGTTQADILYTTVSTRVEKPGEGFRVGQVFRVTSFGGTGSLIKVKSVTPTGGIKAVELISFGTGYATDFNILLTPSDVVDPSTLTNTLGFVQTGTNPLNTTYINDDLVNPQNESGLIVKHDYTNLVNASINVTVDNATITADSDALISEITDTIEETDDWYMQDPTYVGDNVGEIRSQPGAVFATGNYASIRVNVGHVCVYPGYYANGDNIIGDLVYIQDSYYYQVYSYLTTLDETIDSYGDLIKKVLHPAGSIHFARYAISNNLNLSPEVEAVINTIFRGDAFRSFAEVLDLVRVHFNKVIDPDVVQAAEVFSRVVSFFRTFQDGISAAGDIDHFDVTKRLSDPVISSESFNRTVSYIRSYADTARAGGDPRFATDKSLTDSFLLSDTFNKQFSAVRTFQDTVTLDNSAPSFSGSKPISDGVKIGDDYLQIVPGINFNESLLIGDQITSLEPTKYISDSTAIADTGYIYQESYVEVTPSVQYWEAGYLDTERLLTN